MLDAAAPDHLAVAVEEGDGEIFLLQPVGAGSVLESRDGEKERDDTEAENDVRALAGEFDQHPAPAGNMQPVHDGDEGGIGVARPLARFEQRRIEKGVEFEEGAGGPPIKAR